MRIPARSLKCVVFIAEHSGSSTDADSYDPYATGFIVAKQSTVVSGHDYSYLVTALHVAEELQTKPVAFLVNKKEGGFVVLEGVGNTWFAHPTDSSADVAVMPINLRSDIDVYALPANSDMFISKESMFDKDRTGDEVFMPGLFTYAPGSRRLIPITRFGNIAMVPDGPIQVESTFADVYLIEARSIGGLSGSPVFIRSPMALKLKDSDDHFLVGTGPKYELLGLAHGHWDIRESDMNSPSYIQDRRRGVNLGIGVVVPAHKILETINQPDLIALKENAEEGLRRAISPGPDAV